VPYGHASAALNEAAGEFVIQRNWGYAENASGFYDDKYTQLVTAATTEPDPVKRKALYSQINDFNLDQAYCVGICAYMVMDAMRPNVNGLRWRLATDWPIEEMWLA
jgi:ABC-type transport system substrate-binding protein